MLAISYLFVLFYYPGEVPGYFYYPVPSLQPQFLLSTRTRTGQPDTGHVLLLHVIMFFTRSLTSAFAL